MVAFALGACGEGGADSSSDGAGGTGAGSAEGGSGGGDGGQGGEGAGTPVLAGDPVLLFSDLTVAPSSGWSATEPEKGAVVTVWGRRLGEARGDSFITVNGVALESDADYAEPWGQTGTPTPHLQSVAFWLTSDMADGPGEITVTVGGQTSASLPFRIVDGNVRFVDVDAAGAGSGTHDDPWSDPKSFVDTMAPGDVVYFREGTYDQLYNGGKQNIWIRSSETAGTEDSPIGFVGYPGEVPEFDSLTNGSDDLHTSLSFQSGWLTISKLMVTGYATGINAGEGVRVVGNDITGGQVFRSGTGIVVVGDNHGKVLGNSIHGGRTANRLDHAIYISGCAPDAGNELAYNYVWDNDFDRGPMIVVNHQEDRCPTDVFVRSHTIHHNLVDCTDYPSRAIGIYDLSWDGGAETEPEPTIIHHNIAVRCGTAISPALYQNAAHAEWHSNTVYGALNTALSIQGGRVLSSVVHNNVFHLDADAEYIALGDGGTSAVVDTNLYAGSGTYDGDANAITGEPHLSIDVGASVFLLGADSAAIDAALMSGPAVQSLDFNGVPRPHGAGIDVGAVEYVAP